MPWIVESVTSAKGRKDETVLFLSAGTPFGTRQRIVIHKESLRAFHMGPQKTGNGYSCGIDCPVINPGDTLFALSEGYRPDNRYAQGNWRWVKDADAHEKGIRVNDVIIAEQTYRRMTAYLARHVRSEKGAAFREWVQNAKVPPFILDLYLFHSKDLYFRKGNRIYEKDYDYRNSLSPFAKNILRQVEEKGYISVKEILSMTNGDAVIKTFKELGLLYDLEGLYLTTKDLFRDLPRKVREQRAADPRISLSELAQRTGIPKKIMVSLLRESE
ncbi:MAG: hypothetical protein JXB03_00465 [Spirochaetales bacterium]|nr:hypothetical protein [Spirochaetales bacterium]